MMSSHIKDRNLTTVLDVPVMSSISRTKISSNIVCHSTEHFDDDRNIAGAQPQNGQKKLIAGKFVVLDVNNDEIEPTFVVRNVETTTDFTRCRKITADKYRHYLTIRQRLSQLDTYGDDEILRKIWPEEMELVASDEGNFYLITPRHYETLHTYVIGKKKLNESETHFYYRQILRIVAFCHERGIIVRDVKMRKFVFTDEQHERIRLDDLDELFVCESIQNDMISDRHGCPAYVSPEVLDISIKYYAGKPVDVWGLGVLLYVMLTGRYPFYDTTPTGLFGKIRSTIIPVNNPELGLSTELQWLIRCLLRKSPEERPNIHELLRHPWVSNFRSDLEEKESDPSMTLVTTKNVIHLLDLLKSDQRVPSLDAFILTFRKKFGKNMTDQSLEERSG